MPVKTFLLADDWAEEAEAANWSPWPRPPHEYQPPATCLKVNVACRTVVLILIIICSVFVGSASDCLPQQMLQRKKKCLSVICASWSKYEVQFYGGKFLAVPGERGEDKDGEKVGGGRGVESTPTECCTKCLLRLTSQILWVQATADAVLSFTTLNAFKQRTNHTTSMPKVSHCCWGRIPLVWPFFFSLQWGFKTQCCTSKLRSQMPKGFFLVCLFVFKFCVTWLYILLPTAIRKSMSMV